MENKNTLNGFEAILDGLVPNVGTNKNNDIDNDLNDIVSEELTDEELEALRNPKKGKKVEKEETEEEDETEDGISLLFIKDQFECDNCGLILDDAEELELAGIETSEDLEAYLDEWFEHKAANK